MSVLPAWLVSPHSQRIRVPQFQGSLCFGVKLFNVTKHEFLKCSPWAVNEILNLYNK